MAEDTTYDLQKGIVTPSPSEAKRLELITVLATLIRNYANKQLQEGEQRDE